MVKVLPDPVRCFDALDQVLDRRRLVAGRLVFRLHPDGDAAFGLVRSGRAVRHPQFAILVQRIAALDQRRQRRDRCGDARFRQRANILEVDVEAGDGVQASGGALLGAGRAAHRSAATRAGGRGGPLGDLLAGLWPIAALRIHPVRAGGRTDRPRFRFASIDFRRPLQVAHPVRDAARQRRALELRLRRLAEAAERL
jgi:hypothetical protein